MNNKKNLMLLLTHDRWGIASILLFAASLVVPPVLSIPNEKYYEYIKNKIYIDYALRWFGVCLFLASYATSFLGLFFGLFTKNKKKYFSITMFLLLTSILVYLVYLIHYGPSMC